MKRILWVSSNLHGVPSHSHSIAQRIVDELKSRIPGAEVVVRDVANQPLPHAGAAFVTGRRLPSDELDADQVKSIAASDVFVAELQAADIVVVSAPMHNFSVPSSLKAWIDQIVRPGVTFTYSASGPVGLLRGKQLILVLARGGIYSEGPMQAFDFQQPYLSAVFGFIGMDDIRVVRIEGVAMGEAALARGVDSARAQADQVVRELLPTDTSPKERVAA
jgi:FMN-dependent NADH-azoreductase